MLSFRWLSKILTITLIGVILPSFALANGYCGDGIVNNEEQCDDGNYDNRDGCSAYCEIEDMDPPEVSSVSIPDKAENIGTLTNKITVVFSELIGADSVTAKHVRLEHNAEEMDISLKLESDQKTLTITINEDLFSEALHALHIEKITDTSGNMLEGPYEGEFISVFYTAVAIDYTPPNVVVSPPGGTYSFSQEVTIKPYIGDYTGSDEFIDETAIVYYTLNDLNLTENSPAYEDPIRIHEGSTLRYFSVDEAGNKTPVYTERYSFQCPEFANAKEVYSKYPECNILACNPGYSLRNNVCVINLTYDPNDYQANAATAPLFSSDKPMTISSKPAIRITREHHGIIKRPLIFKDVKRGIIMYFEKDTKITTTEGKPFEGYIKPPENLYMKDFPIDFGYSFKSIFKFKDAEGNDLQFSPAYKITIPYTEGFKSNEGVTVLTYNPDNESYSEYNRGLYSYDLDKQEVSISAYRTEIFFIAQSGRSFNRTEFNDITTHWAKNYIEALYRKGVVKGRSKGVYAPNENLTRAEFLKIALKAIDAEIENPDDIEDSPFSDVHLYSWYLPYVKKAKELGLTKGYEDGTFKPEQFINRAEAVKILFSAFGFDLSSRPVTESINTKKKYIDLKGGQWYFPYADFAIQKGIMSGVQDGNDARFSYFGPGNPITRAEMAKLAIKTIELSEADE